ncbi:MAG: ABC transporter substrate-binding protein [Spirochaetales bacterium]
MIAIAMIGLPAASLFAAGEQEQDAEDGPVEVDDVEIDVWHSLSEAAGAEDFERYVEEFNESQDDITVNVSYQGGYTDTLRAAESAVADDNPPNVSMFEQTRGAGFVDAEALVPIGPLVDADPELDLDDFFERLLGTVTIDDEVWGIPYNTSTPIIYYNRDMFREAGLDPDEDVPETWDELLEIGPEFAEYNDDDELEQWAFGLRTNPGWMFDAWLGQAGGQFLSDDGEEWVFNNDAGVEMAEYWLTLVEEDVAVPMDTGTTYDEFFAGNQAMVFQSTATLESYFDQADFDIGAAPLWSGEEEYAPIGGANFYIFDVDDPELHQASYEFLKWIVRERGYDFAAATGYHAPLRETVESDRMQERFEERPEAEITYDQLESYASPRTLVPFWGEVHNLQTLVSEEILLDGTDPQESLDDAVEEANRLLRVYGIGR